MKPKFKKILAISTIALLVLIYLALFITAIFDNNITMTKFRATLAATFIMPVLIYTIMMLYKHMNDKKD